VALDNLITARESMILEFVKDPSGFVIILIQEILDNLMEWIKNGSFLRLLAASGKGARSKMSFNGCPMDAKPFGNSPLTKPLSG
jgi:hypothetical protein